MSQAILIRDCMVPNPATVTRETPITAVIDLLLSRQLSGVPVVDASRRVVGFVSERDCIRKLLVSTYHCDNLLMVRDIMREDTVTVSPNESVFDLARRMDDQKPKIYPVVEDGVLVGVIARPQVLQVLKQAFVSCGGAPESARSR